MAHRTDIAPPPEPPDPERASCYDCTHLKAAVSWWCTNDDAIKWRGTSLPGVEKCPFWRGYDGTPVSESVAARLQPMTEEK